ncbi:hypothetical protein LQZ18_18540 [Lachnospiraceae bacterium ZAX-1]
MVDYLIGGAVVVVFDIAYACLRLRSFRALNIYLSVCELILLILLWKTYMSGSAWLSTNIVFQIVFIVDIAIGYKNIVKRRGLYEIIWAKNYTTILAIGLSNLKGNVYDAVVKIMKKTLVVPSTFSKKCLLLLLFSKEEVVFRFVFWAKEDYLLYKKDAKLDMYRVEEAEEAGKGFILVYKYELSR